MSTGPTKPLRTVVLDSFCHDQLRRLYRNQSFCYGLVLGVPSANGPDYVVHLAITTAGDAAVEPHTFMTAEEYLKVMPPRKEPVLRKMTDEDEDFENASEDDATSNIIKDRKAARKKLDDVAEPNVVSNVVPDLEELISHAQNALRMMPGCCYVLGLFTVEASVPAIDKPRVRDQYQVLLDLAM